MTSTARSNPVRTNERWREACVVLILLLACLGPVPAQAKESDRNQPVKVSAKSADALAKPNGVSHLKGDVIITQGTLKTSGTSATIYFDANSQVSRVVLTGSPARVSQLDDHGNQIKGHANTIDYNIPKGIATLTGNARVDQQNRGTASGNTLVYNTKTSAMTAQSKGDDRVHLTFQPRQETKPDSGSKSTKHTDRH